MSALGLPEQRPMRRAQTAYIAEQVLQARLRPQAQHVTSPFTAIPQILAQRLFPDWALMNALCPHPVQWMCTILKVDAFWDAIMLLKHKPSLDPSVFKITFRSFARSSMYVILYPYRFRFRFQFQWWRRVRFPHLHLTQRWDVQCQRGLGEAAGFRHSYF